DQNRAGISRATLRLLLGSFGGPVDDVPDLPGDGFAKTGTLLIEREDPTGPVEPVPPDAAGCQEPCDLHPSLQQHPTRWRIALGEPVIGPVPRVRIRPGELHFRDIRYRIVQLRESKDLPGRVNLSRVEAEPTRHLGVQRPAGHDCPRATFETGPEGRH